MKNSKKITVKSRLLDFVAFTGVKKSQFYKKTRLGNGFLDKNDNINSDKIEIIASSYPELNIEWLITGKGEMLRGAEPAAQQPTAVKEPAAPPPAGSDVIAIYKELLREKDEKIAERDEKIERQAEQMGILKNENKHQNEQFKKISSENEHLKNLLEKSRKDNKLLQNDISDYREQIVKLRGVSKLSEIPLNLVADPPVGYNELDNK